LEAISTQITEQPRVQETPAAEVAVAEATPPPPAEIVIAAAETGPVAQERSPLVKTGHAEALKDADSRKEPAAMPQSKSVRIALERLDRMMNAVGELVINRTRMLGRVAELERLADVLNFSKARMQDKVAEFQEKYEFSRLTSEKSPPPARPGNGQRA